MLYFGCLGPVWEGGNARGRYDRRQYEHTLAGLVTFRWNIESEGGNDENILPLPTRPRVRLFVDEVTDGAWYDWAPYYLTPVNMDALTPGHHVVRIEADVPGFAWCSNVIFHAGPPLPTDQPQWIWAAPTKFDRVYGALGSDKAVRVWYPGVVPPSKALPLTPRVAEPWTTLLGNDKLWVTRMGVSVGEGLVRRFTVRGGRVGCAPYQQYHFFDQRRTNVSQIDGLRGVSTMGHAIAGRVNPNGSLYWINTQGRLGWTGLTGQTLTIGGQHLRSAPTGTPLKPTPALQPYAYDEAEKAQRLEMFFDFKTPGMQQDFKECWDLAFFPDAPAKPTHPLVLFTDTQPMTGDSASKTGFGRVLMMDHTPAHTGGVAPCWELWKHPVKDAQVWGIDRGPDGRYYVTCCMTHEIWALEIAVDGVEPNVHPRLVSAERVFQSVLRPTLGDLGMTERFEQAPPFSPVVLRERYVKDGAFGSASITFPQSIRFTSDGRAIVAERYTRALRYVDFGARTVQKFSHHWSDSSYTRDWALDINVDGTTGPKDLVRGLLWYSNTDLQWTADGVSHGHWMPEAMEMANFRVVDVPADQMIGQSYPWFVASGYGRLYTGTTGTNGFSMVTKRQPTDPVLDSALYTRGRNAYRYGGGDVPSFTLSHGLEFQGQLGLPIPDELAPLSDLDLAAAFRAGLGTGIPRTYTDAEMAALIYYTRWNAVSNVGPPPPMTRTGPTQLTAVLT